MTEPNPVAVSRARSLRRTQTKQESLLWGKLRDRRLTGYKFVRQAPIGPYFADFLCKEGKLLVELDGSQHGESTTTSGGTAFWLTGVIVSCGSGTRR